LQSEARRTVTTDKTGAPTTVTPEQDRYTISVDGQQVGKAEFLDRDGRRVFTHTEVDQNYEGRGLATILIGEALKQTSDAGMPIVAKCPMVADYVSKHDEFKDATED
jgi:predicted GNAT family acetyltransferase